MIGIIEHTVSAVAIQVVVGSITKNWWAGAALPSGYFLGREVAQAEYRWIEKFGDGLRENLPWNAFLDGRVWVNIDQTADWLGPLSACTIVAFFSSRVRKTRSRVTELR
jgi:hypothetical protein